MNGHTIGNASRRYSTPGNLGLILNILLRVPEYELATGTKSRNQSQLNLDKSLGKNHNFAPPETPTRQGAQEPLPKQENHVVLSNQQANGAFPPEAHGNP